MAWISVTHISCKLSSWNASLMGLPLSVPEGGVSIILGVSAGGG